MKNARWAQAAMLAGILLVGAWLRFSGLTRQGFFFWDEAHHWLQAKTCALSVSWALRHPARLARGDLSGLRELLVREGGSWPNAVGKPTFVGMAALSFSLLGGRDYSSLLLSACLGMAVVCLVYLCALRLDGARSALLSAAILSGLGGHVWYSRLGLSCSAATFFLVLGFYRLLAALDEGKDRCLSAGVLCGLAFTCHDNTAPAIAALSLLLARTGGGRAARFIAGCVVPISAWEAVYRLRNMLSPVPLMSYFGELAWQASYHEPSLRAFLPGHFLEWLTASSGLFGVSLLACGWAWLAASGRGRRNPLEPALWALGPGTALFWTVAFLWIPPAARVYSAALPFLCLGAAVGWGRILDALRPRVPGLRDWGACAAAALFLSGQALASAAYRRARAPYREIAGFLEKHPGRVVSSCGPVFQIYLPDMPYRSVPWRKDLGLGRPDASDRALSRGNVYAAIDSQLYSDALPPDWLREALLRPPVAFAPHGAPDKRLLLMEHYDQPAERYFPGWGESLSRGAYVYEVPG